MSVIKSIQNGFVTPSSSITTIYLSQSVNPDKCFYYIVGGEQYLSDNSNPGGAWSESYNGILRSKTSTSFTFSSQVRANTYFARFSWQVIEFK